MALSSALAQEGVSRVSSYISTKLDDKSSTAHIVARLEMALSRLEFVLERTGKIPITYVSLIRRWKMFRCAYIEGVDLLNKHKLQALQGHEETEPVVVRSSSYSFLERIASAAKLSISSLVGLNKEHLSSSVAQTFEWYADCADKFVTDVESGCPLRRDFFPYPFVRELFAGKTLWYQGMNGSQMIRFFARPLILEGRGVEAWLWFQYVDFERLDRTFDLDLNVWLSESTDLVGAAINCLRSSALLLHNLAAQDAITGQLTQLPNLQDISYSYDPPRSALFSKFLLSDPLCCQANGHEPSGKNTISSELSHIFQEETICFEFSCYIPALEYSFPSASDEAVINVVTDRSPLKLEVSFAPHFSSCDEYVIEFTRSVTERRPFGNIQQTIDMARSRSVDRLIGDQSEMRDSYHVYWVSRHGLASFWVEKPSTDSMAGVPKARRRYNTRSGAKRKRP